MSGPKRIEAAVTRVELLGDGLGRVDVAAPGIGRDVQAGRFAMVEAPGRADCVLLRPYSYFVAPDADRVGLLIRAVGKGTAALLAVTPGTPIVVMGPFGNAFPSTAGDVWHVAGGVGAAPFGVGAERSHPRVLFGARTATELGFARALEAVGATVEVATDDGTAGFAGTVVDLLAQKLASNRPDAIYCCGPTPMMAAAAAVARRHDVPCWVSLEERMGCGFGICRGCAHRDASGGWRCICEDGPVYRAEEIFAEGARSHG